MSSPALATTYSSAVTYMDCKRLYLNVAVQPGPVDVLVQVSATFNSASVCAGRSDNSYRLGPFQSNLLHGLIKFQN